MTRKNIYKDRKSKIRKEIAATAYPNNRSFRGVRLGKLEKKILTSINKFEKTGFAEPRKLGGRKVEIGTSHRFLGAREEKEVPTALVAEDIYGEGAPSKSQWSAFSRACHALDGHYLIRGSNLGIGYERVYHFYGLKLTKKGKYVMSKS